jgi:hypothetical protein
MDLTENEIKVLKLYSDELYENLNLFLMGSELKPHLKYANDEQLNDFLKIMDNAFDKAKQQGFVGFRETLYRGKKRYFPDDKKTFNMKAFSSTSINVNPALEFTDGRCCLYIIDCDVDVAYIDLYKNDISLKGEDEKEVLLDRNTFYHIYHKDNNYLDKHIIAYYIFVSKKQQYPTQSKIQQLKLKYNLVSRHTRETIKNCIDKFNNDVKEDLGDDFDDSELINFLFNKDDEDHLRYLHNCIKEHNGENVNIEQIKDIVGGKKRKTNKRKTNKRKTNKRKTNKSKTNKRKLNKSKTNKRKLNKSKNK